MKKSKEPKVFKITVLGDMGVGKSALCSAIANPETPFNEEYKRTIGVDMFKPALEVGQGRLLNCEIWDVAGWEKTLDMLASYLRGAKQVIFVFDVTNKESFDRLEKWIKDANQYAPNAEKIIVGNKIDLEGRVVEEEEARAFAEQNGAQYFEMSAKDQDNIQQLIQEGIGHSVQQVESPSESPFAEIQTYADILTKLPTNGIRLNNNLLGHEKGKLLRDLFSDTSDINKENLRQILSGESEDAQSLLDNRNRLHISFFKLTSLRHGYRNEVTGELCRSKTEYLLSEAYKKMK